jgi:hypothetical protein
MNLFKIFIVGCVACLGITGCLNDGDGGEKIETFSSSSSVTTSSSSIVAYQSVLDSLDNVKVGQCFNIKTKADLGTASDTEYYFQDVDSILILGDQIKFWVDTNNISLSFAINDSSVFIDGCDTTHLLRVISIKDYILMNNFFISGTIDSFYLDKYSSESDSITFNIQNDDSLVIDTVISYMDPLGNGALYSYIFPSSYLSASDLKGTISDKKLYNHRVSKQYTYGCTMKSLCNEGWATSETYLLEDEGLLYMYFKITDMYSAVVTEKLYYTADASRLSELCNVLDTIPLGLPCK